MFDDLSAFDLVFLFGALAFGFGVVKFMMSVNKPPDSPQPPDGPPSAPPAH